MISIFTQSLEVSALHLQVLHVMPCSTHEGGQAESILMTFFHVDEFESTFLIVCFVCKGQTKVTNAPSSQLNWWL